MNRSYRYSALVALCLLAVVSLFLGWRWRLAEVKASSAKYSETANETNLHQAIAEGASLRSEKDHLQTMVAQLEAQLQDARSGPTVLLSESDVAQLKGLGLKDPVADLREDLAAHSDLIPFEGIAGGTMRFGDAILITSRWVIISFGDGHRSGVGMYRYEVKNGQIRWSALDAYLS